MKKFKNLITGCVENVANPKLIEQYEKHTDRYVEIKGAKDDTPKTTGKKKTK